MMRLAGSLSWLVGMASGCLWGRVGGGWGVGWGWGEIYRLGEVVVDEGVVGCGGYFWVGWVLWACNGAIFGVVCGYWPL